MIAQINASTSTTRSSVTAADPPRTHRDALPDATAAFLEDQA